MNERKKANRKKNMKNGKGRKRKKNGKKKRFITRKKM